MTPGPPTPTVTRPLTDLDQVPWAELRHCYGPATNVPAQLRDLTSPDEDTRAKAWYRTESNLYHQGNVYEATPHTVPFLLHLLADEATPGRKRLLCYLSALVTGEDDSQWFPDGYDTARTEGWPVETAVYEAVGAGVPTVVVPLLDHDDPEMAGLAAMLAAWFPRHAPLVLPALRRLCDRPLPRPERATALIALGLLAGAAGDRSDTALLERALADGDDPDRWAAAVALARVTASDIPPSAIGVLTAELGVICTDLDAYEMTARTHFCYGNVGELIPRTLDRLPPERRETARDCLVRTLRQIEQQDSEPSEAADWAVTLAVYTLPTGQVTDAAQLTSFQSVVLQALLSSDRAWASGDLGPLMSDEYGLPDTPDALRAWLDLP
ncbi:hypothetical protein AB0903_13595 [Streptomyces sp. NPDC048389]|uniref:hypothetical protein n=1 Tax=Streptomyces sp. NPDC048389 TaxID=3154622 RepID=UPI0034556DFB